MSQAFSFGFSGDDIQEDPDDVPVAQGANAGADAAADAPAPVQARTLHLDELLGALPDKLSYSILRTTSPAGRPAFLPRREIFDIRMQVMAEDDSSNPDILRGLDATDVHPLVYEGGYKTWECSVDLLRFLLDRGPRKDLDDLARVNHIIEMGCGTALPGLLCFQYAVRNRLGISFTFTDYNADVLRLVTIPNLILAFAATLGATDEPFSSDSPNPLAAFGNETGYEDSDGQPEKTRSKGVQFDNGDLELTPALIDKFKQTITELGIAITLVSGSWTPTERLLQLIPSDPSLNTFVLASETIYSPASLTAFTEAMVELLKRVKSGKAVVAAKRVYFGVGGSVDEFRIECSKRGCVAYEMDFEGLDSNGVRRCLVEVQVY